MINEHFLKIKVAQIIFIPSHHFSLPFLSSHFWKRELSGGWRNEKRKHTVGKKAIVF